MIREIQRVSAFSNDIAQDVEISIETTNYKHGIYKDVLEAMPTTQIDELDDTPIMYLYSKLEGEPAR